HRRPVPQIDFHPIAPSRLSVWLAVSFRTIHRSAADPARRDFQQLILTPTFPSMLLRSPTAKSACRLGAYSFHRAFLTQHDPIASWRRHGAGKMGSLAQAPRVKTVPGAEHNVLFSVQQIRDDTARFIGVELVMPQNLTFIGAENDHVLLIIA